MVLPLITVRKIRSCPVTRSGRSASFRNGSLGKRERWQHEGPADIRDKYAKLTRRIVSAERQAAIEKAVLGLDTLDDVAQLTTLLTPAVRSPLD